jgi:hypothetical protein
VNAICPGRLNEELQGSARNIPSHFFRALNPLPKSVISVSNPRNSHPVVLSVTALCGTNVSIASRWISTLHLGGQHYTQEYCGANLANTHTLAGHSAWAGISLVCLAERPENQQQQGWERGDEDDVGVGDE